MATGEERSTQAGPAVAVALEAPEGSAAMPRVNLDDYIGDAPAPVRALSPAPCASAIAARGMCTAHVASIAGSQVSIRVRGAQVPVEAAVAPDVELEVIAEAHLNRDAVLVELCEGEAPLIVAALRTRRPQAIHLKADTIAIEGREVLLRAGTGALRIREDGFIEIVGSRISAASRGLFRIVGRLLRLN